MKSLITGKHRSAVISVAGGLALMLVTGAAMAGIANTKHNLVSTNAANNRFAPTSAVQAEICVFCHTPHGATEAVQAPLWNKGIPAGNTYQVYNTAWSSTIDGVLANDGYGGTGAIGSVSLACLSCHDGTQAMNNMINQPGSGGWDSTYAGASLAGTWTAGTGTPTPVVVLSGKLGTGIGNLSLPSVVAGTVDLRSDHPIGIQYCGGGPNPTTPGAACNDGDYFAPKNGSIGGQTVFWVGASATRTKTQLALFNRSFPANGALAAGTYPSIECATCHDPHVENVAGSNPTFLRVANTGSALCLTCHNK